MDCNSVLEKALAFEAEFDKERDARIKEFTRAISEILEQPNAAAKLDFIARLMNDPDLLDATAAKLGI